MSSQLPQGRDIPSQQRQQRQPQQQQRRPPRQGGFSQRDTHFLCLPLVTDTSIPQLAASLSHFRHVSLPSSERGDIPESSSSTETEVTNQANLQIIPEKAHRPPGTFHLTLGVMNLGRPEQMERARRLLESLDLARILRDVTRSTNVVGGPVDEDGSHDKVTTIDRGGEDSTSLSELFSHSSSPPPTVATTTTTTTTNIPSLTRPVSPPLPLPLNISSQNTSPSPSSSSQQQQQQRQPPSLRTPQLSISLTGLSTFPSHQTARVFYAKPQDPSFRIMSFSQIVRQHFRQAGFITETRPLVLHATIANLKYLDPRGRGGRKGKAKVQVDARELIEVFDMFGGTRKNSGGKGKGMISIQTEKGEYVWAKDVLVNSVAICKLGAVESDDPVLGLEYPPVFEKMIF